MASVGDGGSIGNASRSYLSIRIASTSSSATSSEPSAASMIWSMRASAARCSSAVYWSLLSRESPPNGLRLALDHAQENPRRAFGAPYALFPLPQGREWDTEGCSKCRLGHAQPLPRSLHVHFGHFDLVNTTRRHLAFHDGHRLFQGRHQFVGHIDLVGLTHRSLHVPGALFVRRTSGRRPDAP